MKKILSVILSAIIIILIGCGADKKNNESSDITILNNKIDHLTIQFKANTVTITDDEKIQSIRKMFDGELKRNEALDKEKGWIYKVTANDSNNEQIEEFFIINDTNIRINDKTYTCEKIILSRLDEIFEIDREN
ncbi:MAG: hypothetical protein HFI34_12445 [Lachnospiraceae bacterium]|nr:hypothetical protein [Lachnospiraceae bacterium]